PNTPGLLGVSRDYLNAQLGAWQTGQRHAQAPDCMAKIAKQLAPDDVTAVAAWLASQPVSADPHPAAVAARKPPLECGGTTLPASPEKAVEAAASVSRGAYLARVGNCIACHTERGGTSFAGGRAIDTPFGTVYSSNLTPDNATGIGSWSASDFWRALHE